MRYLKDHQDLAKIINAECTYAFSRGRNAGAWSFTSRYATGIKSHVLRAFTNRAHASHKRLGSNRYWTVTWDIILWRLLGLYISSVHLKRMISPSSTSNFQHGSSISSVHLERMISPSSTSSSHLLEVMTSSASLMVDQSDTRAYDITKFDVFVSFVEVMASTASITVD